MTPGDELKLSDYNFAFLPGNILQITAAFTNTTANTYEQPFSFSGTSTNVVSTTEPGVSNADLGGDSKLSPGETTTVLTFEAEHKGQAFTYNVSAEASVICGERPEGVDLKVTQTDAQDPVEFDYRKEEYPEFTYTVTVANVGGEAADEVKLTDTFEMNGEFFPFTIREMPSGCEYASEPESDDIWFPFPFSSSIVCDLGTLASGDSKVYTFTFSDGFRDFKGQTDKVNLEPQEEPGFTVTNTAEVTTTSSEVNTENNTSVGETTATFGESTGSVDLAITQAAPETAQVGERVFYDIKVTNNGTQDATDIKIIDRLYFDDEALLVGDNSFCGYNGRSGSDERGDYQETECSLSYLAAGQESAFYY